MTSLREFRAQLDSANPDAERLIENDPLALPHGISSREKVDLLEQRRRRYWSEANLIAVRCEATGDEPDATQSLFMRRLLDNVALIDAELPRLREIADADEQHVETCRKYGVAPFTTGDPL